MNRLFVSLALMAAIALAPCASLAQNITVKDASGTSQTINTKLNGGVNTPASVPTDSGGGDMTDTTNHALKGEIVLALPPGSNTIGTVNLGTLNGAATAAGIATLNATLGSPFQAGGALGAGSAIIGKFGIDQTTPGTTNAVSVPSPANFTPAQVSVGATATLIVAARTGRNTEVVENTGTTPVYLGGSGVTTSTGLLLPGVVGASLTLQSTAAIYGITASGTQTVSEAETY